MSRAWSCQPVGHFKHPNEGKLGKLNFFCIFEGYLPRIIHYNFDFKSHKNKKGKQENFYQECQQKKLRIQKKQPTKKQCRNHQQ